MRKSGVLSVIAVVAIITGCGATGTDTPAKARAAPKPPRSAVLDSMVADMLALKPTHPPLADLEASCVGEHGLRYSYRVEYVKGPDKTQSGYRAKADGCVIAVQVFSEGDGWAGNRGGLAVSSGRLRCKGTGHLVDYCIDCPDDSLRKKLEDIILAHAGVTR